MLLYDGMNISALVSSHTFYITGYRPSIPWQTAERKISEKPGNCIFIVYSLILHLRGGVSEFVFLILFLFMDYKYYMITQI